MLMTMRNKALALSRLMLIKGFSRFLDLYVVNEYPKSGGSWVAQMLSEYLGLLFPRNKMPKFQSSVLHGHFLFSPSIKKPVIVLRDGRDIMVSYYFYSFFKNERFNAPVVDYTRKKLKFEDYTDIRTNLPKFIEYKFTHRRHPRFTWAEFVNNWMDREVALIRYENLLQDGVKELGQAINKACEVMVDNNRLVDIVEKYSFRKMAKRSPGEENRHSFLRKGIAGDWKNYFTTDARKIFNNYAGKELIKLGYETSKNWVERDTF